MDGRELPEAGSGLQAGAGHFRTAAGRLPDAAEFRRPDHHSAFHHRKVRPAHLISKTKGEMPVRPKGRVISPFFVSDATMNLWIFLILLPLNYFVEIQHFFF